MKKRIFAIVLTFAMLLTLLPTGNYSAAQAGLMFRWCVQDGNGDMIPDSSGNYQPDKNLGESYEHEMYENTCSPVFFYYVDFNGKEVRLTLKDLESSDTSKITLEDDHGSVLIRTTSSAKVGDVVYIHYKDIHILDLLFYLLTFR